MWAFIMVLALMAGPIPDEGNTNTVTSGNSAIYGAVLGAVVGTSHNTEQIRVSIKRHRIGR